MTFLTPKRANTVFGPFLLLCSIGSVLTELSYIVVKVAALNEECIEYFELADWGKYYAGIWGPLPSIGVFIMAILIKCNLTRRRLVIEFVFTLISIIVFLVFIIFNTVMFNEFNVNLACHEGFGACVNKTSSISTCQECKSTCEQDSEEVTNIFWIELAFAILGIVFASIITVALGLVLMPRANKDNLQEGRFVQAFDQENRRVRVASAKVAAKNQKVTFEKNAFDPPSRQISTNSTRGPQIRRQDSNISRKSSTGSKRSTQSAENSKKLTRMDSFPSSLLK